MLVYRVELPFSNRVGNCPEIGIGPYQPYPLERYLTQEKIDRLYDMACTHMDDAHPSPQREGYWMNGDQACALSSRDDLLRWFRGHLELLRDCGFVVGVYEAEVDYCGRQIIFNVPTARLVRYEAIC